MSSIEELGAMPLDKVCELVCAHAELQSEHARLQKKVKMLQAEIEEVTSKRHKEVTARLDHIALTSERHIAALSLNCDETMRRKFREVDDIMVQMRRDMFDRVSAAIASSPPPAVKRMRTVASQALPIGGRSTADAARNAETSMTSPIGRRIHALSELVAMSTDSSFGGGGVGNADSSSGAIDASGASQTASFGIHSAAQTSTLVPAAPQQYANQSATALHQQPRLYQHTSAAYGNNSTAAAAPHASNSGSNGSMMMIHGGGGQLQQQQQQVRYDMTPGLNVSHSAPTVASVTPGVTSHEGDLHTFLW